MNTNIPLEPAGPGAQEPAERADAAANRQRILAAAERLFAEHGVATVNMADIAAAAEVGKGTLYRRFCNKGELCLALMDNQLRDFQDRRLEVLRQMSAEGRPFAEQLIAFLEALVTFTETHSPLLLEVQQHSRALDEQQVERPHFWQYMTVHGLLRMAVAAGEMPADLDIAYAAEALLAPLNAHTFRFQREVRGFTLERISRGLRMLVHAFCGQLPAV